MLSKTHGHQLIVLNELFKLSLLVSETLLGQLEHDELEVRWSQAMRHISSSSWEISVEDMLVQTDDTSAS